MKTIKRLLLGLTLGMLLVGCSPDPITETQQQVEIIEQVEDVIVYCNYIEQLPYIITEQSQTNWQSDFRKYKRTYKSKNLTTGVETILRVEIYITSTQLPADQLNVWICN